MIGRGVGGITGRRVGCDNDRVGNTMGTRLEGTATGFVVVAWTVSGDGVAWSLGGDGNGLSVDEEEGSSSVEFNTG